MGMGENTPSPANAVTLTLAAHVRVLYRQTSLDRQPGHFYLRAGFKEFSRRKLDKAVTLSNSVRAVFSSVSLGKHRDITSY
jgi:hypothetical protein